MTGSADQLIMFTMMLLTCFSFRKKHFALEASAFGTLLYAIRHTEWSQFSHTDDVCFCSISPYSSTVGINTVAATSSENM